MHHPAEYPKLYDLGIILIYSHFPVEETEIQRFEESGHIGIARESEAGFKKFNTNSLKHKVNSRGIFCLLSCLYGPPWRNDYEY